MGFFLEEMRLALSRTLAGDFTTPVTSPVSDSSCGDVTELLEKIREMFFWFEKDLGAIVVQIVAMLEEVQWIIAQIQRIFGDSTRLETPTAFLDSALEKLSSPIQAGEKEIVEIDVAFASFERLFRVAEELAQGTRRYLETAEHTLEATSRVFHPSIEVAGAGKRTHIAVDTWQPVTSFQQDMRTMLPGVIRNEETLQRVRELQERTSSSEIRSLAPDMHYQILRRFLEVHPLLEAIHTTKNDGTFIAGIPPAGLADARLRPWWHDAMKGRAYISEVYVSAIARESCVTVSMPILGFHGAPWGTLGADVALKGR